MPEQLHVAPDGVKYRLIATRTTTPTSDSEAKEIQVETSCVEVVVSDSRAISRGSQFGHVAIIVNGIAYSRAHEAYDSKRLPLNTYRLKRAIATRSDMCFVYRRRKKIKLRTN